MERERLNRLVEAPDKVGKEDLADLRDLAERYPWFAGAQVLNSMGQHLAGEVLSDETLTTAAAHVPSRTVLFDLMGTPRPLAPMSVVPSDTIVEDDTTAPAQEEPPPMEHSEPPSPVATVEPGSGTVPGPVETDPLERQFLEAALASSYDLSWMQPPLSEPASTIPVVPPPPALIEPVPVPTAGDAEVEATPLPEPVRPSAPRPSRMRFTDWLAAEATSFGAPEESATGSPTAEAPTAPLAPRPTVQAVIPAAEILDTRDLIDRFISQQDPQPKVKAEFYTPQQAAKRSLDDSSGMVTETLARIYAKQGDLPKAIDAYRRLALKYPEKSAYFAALSKELEGQLNK